jgi:hypothetical protein
MFPSSGSVLNPSTLPARKHLKGFHSFCPGISVTNVAQGGIQESPFPRDFSKCLQVLFG